MKTLFSPWFGFKLLTLVVLDLVQLGSLLFPWWSAVSSSSLLLVVLCSFFLNPARAINLGLVPEEALSPTQKLSLVLSQVPLETGSVVSISLPESDQELVVSSLQVQNQNLLSQQPTSRDLLINAAILSLWLGQTDQANQYLSQAQKIDPLHPFLPVLASHSPDFSVNK